MGNVGSATFKTRSWFLVNATWCIIKIQTKNSNHVNDDDEIILRTGAVTALRVRPRNRATGHEKLPKIIYTLLYGFQLLDMDFNDTTT